MTEFDRRTALKAGAATAFLTAFGSWFAAPPRAHALAVDPATSGQWSAPLDLGGIAIHATLTHTDDILIFQYVEGQAGVDHTSWVGTYNWITGATLEAPLPYHRDIFCVGNNLLPDGRVFLAGGHDHNTGKKQDPVGVAETDTWTPSTRSWTQGPVMAQKRWYPTTIGLANGRTLIFGGHERPGVPSNTVEEFDPLTMTLRQHPVSANKGVGLYPRVVLAPSGKVFKVGAGRSTTVFDPVTSTWAAAGRMLFGARNRGNAVVLPGGTRVLAVGGQVSSSAAPTGTAEILDLAAARPAWTYTGSLKYPRILAQTINLPDGSVLILGGGAKFKYTGPVLIPELYNPTTGTWTEMAPQQGGRMYHGTALLLPDGRVFSAGQDNGPFSRTAEIFSPPYLFRGDRPTISSAPSSLSLGETFTIGTPEAPSIGTVTLIRAGSTTHQVDTDQRSIPLSFTASGTSLNATVPTNGNLVPPGYYLLFIVNRDGVPSVAPWVRLG